jgi:hypothetical protein
MKAVVTVLVASCFFVLGCGQDDLVNTPSAGVAENALVKDGTGPGSQQGVLLLDGILVDPSGLNSICEVSGEIRYVSSGIGGESTRCIQVSYSLSTSGEVTSTENEKDSWVFEDESGATVCAGPGGAVVEKVYSLAGRSDGVALHVVLILGQTSPILDHMWLALPSIDPSAD